MLGTWKKIYCNTSYVQAICMIYLVAWSGNNEDLWLCLWFPSLAFFWSINPEPYLCTGFDCGLCVSTSIIALTKNRSVITASYASCCTSDCHNHFLVAARNMQYHCHTGSQDFHRMSCHWVDVTSSQSKSQCLLTSFSQTTQVKNCTINMVSYSAACW